MAGETKRRTYNVEKIATTIETIKVVSRAGIPFSVKVEVITRILVKLSVPLRLSVMADSNREELINFSPSSEGVTPFHYSDNILLYQEIVFSPDTL